MQSVLDAVTPWTPILFGVFMLLSVLFRYPAIKWKRVLWVILEPTCFTQELAPCGNHTDPPWIGRTGNPSSSPVNITKGWWPKDSNQRPRRLLTSWLRMKLAARRVGHHHGMSGSGKASVLKAFEDLGYYCVDNLPLD